MRRLAVLVIAGLGLAGTPDLAAAGHVQPHLTVVRTVSIGDGVEGLNSVTDARRHRVYVASQGTMTSYNTLTRHVVAVPYDRADPFSDPSLQPSTGNVYACGIPAITIINGDRVVARRPLPPRTNEAVCALDPRRGIYYALAERIDRPTKLVIFTGTHRSSSIALPGLHVVSDNGPEPVVDESTGDVYFGGPGDKHLMVVNRHGLVKQIRLASWPFRMTIDPNRDLVICQSRNGNVTQIHGVKIVHTVTLPAADKTQSYSGGPVVSPSRDETYLVGTDHGRAVTVLSGHHVVRTIAVPEYVGPWGYDPRRDVLYVGDHVLRHGKLLGANPDPLSKKDVNRAYVYDPIDRAMLMFEPSLVYLLRSTHVVERMKSAQFDFMAGFEPARDLVYGIDRNQIEVFRSNARRR